jgi:hypothetical protein
MWFDPVSIDLQSPQGVNLSYSLATNALSNGLASSFVSVGGNVELVVSENAAGTFNLDVSNVPSEARGGVVALSAAGFSSQEFTDALQSGITGFSLTLGGNSTGVPSTSSNSSSSGATTVVGSTTAGAGPTGPTGDSTGVASATVGSVVSASTAVAMLTGLIAGPVGTTSGSSASSSTGSTATASAAPASAATAVTQPLPRSVREPLSGDSEEAPGEEEGTPPLSSLETVLQVVKKVLSQASGVMGALGWKSPSAVLRRFREMLEKLSAPAAGPSATNDSGTRTNQMKDAQARPGLAAPAALLAPMPRLMQGAGAIDSLLWDEGIDGLLEEGDRVDSAWKESRSAALWAAALLASGLVRSEVAANTLRPGRSERRSLVRRGESSPD